MGWGPDGRYPPSVGQPLSDSTLTRSGPARWRLFARRACAGATRLAGMTFSIVGRSADGAEMGVAVASKFLAAGAYVPAAAVGAGALATQARCNLELRTRGLEMLAAGTAKIASHARFQWVTR